MYLKHCSGLDGSQIGARNNRGAIPLNSGHTLTAACILCQVGSKSRWPSRNQAAFASPVKMLLRHAQVSRIDHIGCLYHTKVWAPAMG